MVNTFDNGSADNDFNNTTNWTDGALPGASETFYIQADAVLSDDVTVGTFTLYNGYTLDLNGYHLDASSGTGFIYIGNSTAATNTTKLLINAGELTAPSSISSRGTPECHITTGRVVACDDFNWGNASYDAKMYVDNNSGSTDFISYCNQFSGGHLTVSGTGPVDESAGGSARAVCKRFNWQRMEPGNSRITFRSGEGISSNGANAYTYLASGQFYDLWYDDLDDTTNHYHTIIGDITCLNIINVSSSASTNHPVLRFLGQKDRDNMTLNSYKQTIMCSGANDPYGSTGSLLIQNNCTVSGGFADFDLGAHAQVGNVPYVNRHWGLNIDSNGAFHASGAHAGLFGIDDDYITLANDPTIAEDGPFTLSAWVKPQAGSGGPYSIGGENGNDTDRFNVTKSSATSLRIGFYINNADEQSNFATVVDDDWVHIAVVRGTTNDLIFYINGVDVGYTKNRTTMNEEFEFGQIGRENTTQYFKGQMADIRLYDVSCSAAGGTSDGTPISSGSVGLADINPAPSVTDQYAASGTGLIGWWKLNTTGRQVLAGTRAFDVSDSSTSGTTYNGTNNGVTSAEPWITMSSWRNNNGQFWVKNGYLEWKGRHSTGAYGEWGKYASQGGATNDFDGSYLDQQLQTSNSYILYGSNPDAGIICKEWNIWPKSGTDRLARVYGGSGGPTCLVDVTGNLCINSEFADGGNDETIFEPYETGPDKYFQLTADNIYVSGTLNWAESIYTPTDPEWATVLTDQTVTCRDSFYIGPSGTYIATPGITHVNDAPFFVNEGTFTTSSGTVLIDDAAAGGFAFSGADSPLTFYNLTISGAKVVKSNLTVNIENDLELKNCTGAGPHWRPYGTATPTYVGGNVIVGDGCGMGSGYLNRTGYTSPVYISGSLILASGSELWLPNIDYLEADVVGKDFWIYGNLINNGGEIIETVGDWS